MAVKVATDNREILAALDAAVLADPVRHTVLGSIRGELWSSGRDSWCAFDGLAVAVRSDGLRPVALSERWADLAPLVDALAELAPLAGLGGPVGAVRSVVELLDREPARETAERLFRCDSVQPPAGVAGGVRRATATDRDLLAGWVEAFLLEAFGALGPGFDGPAWVDNALARSRIWLWLDERGEPVSMAAQRSPAAGVARIGPVFTPPAHRGRGFGSAVTAHAAGDVLSIGAVPVLYTDLANPTSNKIYRAIGFRPVSDRLSVDFDVDPSAL